MTAALVRDADPVQLAAAVGALSKSDVAALDRAEAEAYVVACERVRAAFEARQALAMDTLAGRVEDDLHRQQAEAPLSAGTRSIDTHGLVASTLSPALHCATRTVQRRLVGARWLACEFAATFDAAWDGDLEQRRSDVVVEAGLAVSADLRGAYEALVLESSVDEVTGEYVVVSERMRELSRSELVSRCRKIARELDPDSEQAALQRARDARRVVIQPHPDQPGMARWVVVLPTETSQRLASAVDALAGQYARANPGTPIDAARADALADLALAQSDVTTVVELLVPVLPAPAELVAEPAEPESAGPESAGPESAEPEPKPGESEPVSEPAEPEPAEPEPAEPEPAGGGASQPREGAPVRWVIPGVVDDPRHGALTPEVIARILSDPDVSVRLARLDPDGSIVQDPRRYRPSASVRRRVRSRDGLCRFPGCHTPARQTDLDHVVAFPVGPTDPANLLCLCRTHHGFKHHGGWTLTLAKDARATWRAPDGRTWVTEPRPAQVRDDLRLTDGIGADRLHDLRRGWLPGLPIGMTPADLTDAEDRLPDDPPESPATPLAPPDWVDLDDARPWPPPGPHRDLVVESLASGSALEQQLAQLLALAA
ncbi:hypothetical protein SAMN04489867_1828 [Pedococcus dokdonensis]|uniref:HNH nuclease domain-containing protein n=1 Tax=Pedococcus dokdonensis TaxID=443156 RepID=A0A1H0R3K5_9MICO|nr:HNH endonuclease signature motif containing protein [Pedococcus dokdonensis]SDP24000.1 hypothetical protein SAMN04489867_1828 [Pedococcus dokdonensis]